MTSIDRPYYADVGLANPTEAQARALELLGQLRETMTEVVDDELLLLGGVDHHLAEIRRHVLVAAGLHLDALDPRSRPNG